MRDSELIPTILAACGAQSVLVWTPGTELRAGTEWRLEEVDGARFIEDLAREGVRGYVRADDARIRALVSADRTTCNSYFFAVADDTCAGLVAFGFADGVNAPDEEAVRAVARLAASAFTPVDVDDTDAFRASDVIDIANGSAHAIGTPLNVISGNAEAILRSSAEDSPHRRSLETIVEQAHRVADTVRRAVAIVRREPSAKARPISWPELVADTLAMSSAMLKRLECRARWIDTSNTAGLVTVDVPAAIGDLFVILRDLAERAGPKGTLMIRPSATDAGAIEIEGHTGDGATVAVTTYSPRQSAAASSVV